MSDEDEDIWKYSIDDGVLLQGGNLGKWPFLSSKDSLKGILHYLVDFERVKVADNPYKKPALILHNFTRLFVRNEDDSNIGYVLELSIPVYKIPHSEMEWLYSRDRSEFSDDGRVPNDRIRRVNPYHFGKTIALARIYRTTSFGPEYVSPYKERGYYHKCYDWSAGKPANEKIPKIFAEPCEELNNRVFVFTTGNMDMLDELIEKAQNMEYYLRMRATDIANSSHLLLTELDFGR